MWPLHSVRISGIPYVIFVSVTFYVLCAIFVLTMVGSHAEVYRSYLEHKRKRYDGTATSMVWPGGEDSAAYQDSLVNSNIQKTAYTDVSCHRITNTVWLEWVTALELAGCYFAFGLPHFLQVQKYCQQSQATTYLLLCTESLTVLLIKLVDSSSVHCIKL
jgi:hypothetical protein